MQVPAGKGVRGFPLPDFPHVDDHTVVLRLAEVIVNRFDIVIISLADIAYFQSLLSLVPDIERPVIYLTDFGGCVLCRCRAASLASTGWSMDIADLG